MKIFCHPGWIPFVGFSVPFHWFVVYWQGQKAIQRYWLSVIFYSYGVGDAGKAMLSAEFLMMNVKS